MNERLFQFIWEHQLFNRKDLTLESGELISVIHPGKINPNQGPDFLEAMVRIGETLWAGQVELHLKASDWFRHFHNEDVNYENVILHVVLENDRAIEPGLPTLVLQDRIPTLLVNHYAEMMKSRFFIPCQELLKKSACRLNDEFKSSLITDRFNRKSCGSEKDGNPPGISWEEKLWHKVARAFGGTVNGEAFESMAKSIALNILLRHGSQIHQAEALLLGQSGMLEGSLTDPYLQLLSREYRFLQKKYRLIPVKSPVHLLRMRPMNFPAVRLGQLAMLYCQHPRLFNAVKDLEDLNQVMKFFEVTANDFWHYHYTLEDTSGFMPKKTGRELVHRVLINALIPVLYAYGSFFRDQVLVDRMQAWLLEIPDEDNKITRGFKDLGIESANAFDTQALLELKQNYCDIKRCLDCHLGRGLLGYRLAGDS